MATLLVVFVPVGLAASHAGVPIALDAESTGPARLGSVETLTLDHAALMVRTREPASLAPAFSLHGQVGDLAVERHEASWPLVETPAGGGGSINVGPTRTMNVTRYPGGSIRYDPSPHGSASVLMTDRLNLEVNGASFDLMTTVRDPHVASMRTGDVPLSANLPDEKGILSLPGDFVVGPGPGFAGTGSGAFMLYWFNGVVTIAMHESAQRLESKVWDDVPVSDPFLHVRHAVWYVLRSHQGHLQIGAGPASDHKDTVLMARTLMAANVPTFSMDTVGSLNGSLPRPSEETGSSVWLQGALDISIRALDGNPEPGNAERPAPGYQVSISGTSSAYAIGGRLPVTWGNSRILAEAATAGLGAAALVWLAKTFAYGPGRIWLPMVAKLERDELLRHPSRARIMRMLAEQPGVHFTAIFRRLRDESGQSGPGFGWVLHHLALLERFKFILSCREGRFRRYFVATDAAAADAESIALLRKDRVRQIAKTIVDRHRLTVDELRQATAGPQGMAPSTLAYHLGRLQGRGLVIRERGGRRHYLSPSDQLVRLLKYFG